MSWILDHYLCRVHVKQLLSAGGRVRTTKEEERSLQQRLFAPQTLMLLLSETISRRDHLVWSSCVQKCSSFLGCKIFELLFTFYLLQTL